MAVKLGSGTISKLYLGSTEITKAYLGSTEVYSTSSIPANAITQRDGSYILDRSGSYIETRA